LDAGLTCNDAGPNLTCSVNTAIACGCDHETYENDCEAASYGINVDFEGTCPALPSGPCTSQADCGDLSYAKLVFCKAEICGSPAGHCTTIPGACPELFEPVCGCDGRGYTNDCFSDLASVGVAYGGPCRSGAITACAAVQPCPNGQTCINDPRAACAGAACSGVCVAACAEGACGAVPGDAGLTAGCLSGTQACVANATGTCDAGLCGSCVYTTGSTCDSTTPCQQGQLCVPAACAGSACPSYCVVP
jgi:hypothetical protein